MGDIIKKNIGKNTIGDNGKMSVNLRTYNRSTHDLSYVWRNTQSVGTLVPFMCEVAQPGDTFKIDLNADVLTHPTVGPLFGSFKLQLDVYSVPFRLYNAWLHNNRLGIGNDMSKVKLPLLSITLNPNRDNPTTANKWSQINPSCLLSYLGNKGYGYITSPADVISYVNAIPTIAYYDIFKNYYANKQEPKFYTIVGGAPITKIEIGDKSYNPNESLYVRVVAGDVIKISPWILPSKVICTIGNFGQGDSTDVTLSSLGTITGTAELGYLKCTVNIANSTTIKRIRNSDNSSLGQWDLTTIDDLRDKILQAPGTSAFIANVNTVPYMNALGLRNQAGDLNTTNPQFGLALKTYNSDLYNNWINTEWLDGENGVNAITAVDTSSGSFTMDALNMQKKLYILLNRIAVSGGTFRDWVETVYTNEYLMRAETPTFEGGMSQEIVFQEVVSNSATENEPLGTLAGRGKLSGNKKGGHIEIRFDEPCYAIGIVSITPRIDYNQGNRYDTYFRTLNDLHKPQLDGIGYQNLMVDEMAWWNREIKTNSVITRNSVGKQPAWINYMTNVNKTFGNFAIENNEAFMVLNRNYEMGTGTQVKDITTYIDPVKYNYIFADTSLDAMNFWVQIGVNLTARRKMSAKEIPNL